MPAGAILPDALTEAQRAEIAARIAALAPEAKEAEKQARLGRRAEIQGKAFDTAAWYAGRQDGIEAKYA